MDDKTNTPRYSLVVPWTADQIALDQQIDILCQVFESATEAPYEILAVDRAHLKEVAEDWGKIKGEVLLVVDGTLKEPPGLLKELIGSFEKGADLALSGHYANEQHDAADPAFVCFGIRRTVLAKVKESPESFGLTLNLLGPEAIRRMSGNSEQSDSHLTTYLKHLIGFSK